MKPVNNMINPDHPTLGYLGNNVLMRITPDEKDGEKTFYGIYNFDLLMKAFEIIKKEYPALKPETRNHKPDQRRIEIITKKCNGGSVLSFRVINKENVMYPENGDYIALAPIVRIDDNKNQFEEYDKKQADEKRKRKETEKIVLDRVEESNNEFINDARIRGISLMVM